MTTLNVGTVAVAVKKEDTMARGRKAKVKAPTKVERLEKLKNAILKLNDSLVSQGFEKFLPKPGKIQVTEEVDADPKTGGFIGKVKEPLGEYLQRVSIVDNYAQRPPFDHAEDPIYRRLIRDFIEGAAMPESKVAVLSGTADHKAESLEDTGKLQFSVVDGLQRLYCFCVAILLVLDREKLVEEGVITGDAWKFFGEAVQAAGDSKKATEELLGRQIRYEVFYNIDLGGLLHYMVTFNTGQRRMNLPVQLEIMRKPLIEELEDRAGIPIWFDQQKMPGAQKPKDKFAASDLIVATEAFISNNSQVTASNEAERFLNEDQRYLDNVGDITDVVKALKRIGTEIHSKIVKVYVGDINKQYILSSGGTFLIALAAACGFVRNRNNMKMLDGALDKLEDLLERPVEDPMRLDEYFQAVSSITASRGKTTRRLVLDTFGRFFMGATPELEWLDTARSISGTNL